MTINGHEIKTVAVDFDGTLFVEKYPDIGDPIMPMINYVKSLKDEGIELILYTAREGELLEAAIAECKRFGIEFDAVNENMQWRVDKWGACRKIAADLYLDDRAVSLLSLPCILKHRIASNTELRDAYAMNPYMNQAIQHAMENEGDLLPAVFALADRLYKLEADISAAKLPPSKVLN